MPDERPALLVVSPDVGLDTIGGERIRKLTSSFDEQGWRLIGIAPPARDYLSSHAPWPESLELERTFDLNPWTLAVRMKRLRRSGAPTATPHGAETPEDAPPAEATTKAALRKLWPYPWTGWVPFAVARGVAVARRERPVALLSSFPPTASHLAALAVHRITGLPWIADFRDPWTWGGRHGYVWANDRRITVRTEAEVLRTATVLTSIGPSLGAEVARRAAREVVVLPHGIPVERPFGVARASPFERLELVHAGTVDSWSADVTPVVRALLRLTDDGVPARLTLVGPVDHRTSDLERAEGLGLVRELGRTSREEAQRIAAAADVAVIVQKRPSKIWVTTKLWDYLASGTAILVAADPSCDAAAIVRETRTGWSVPWDEDEIVVALRDAYERRLRGDELWAPDETALARYDAKSVSGRFVELLRAQR